LLLFSGSGMAAGGWIAGLLYDHLGYYAPAFAVGIGANILNLLIVAVLVGRKRQHAIQEAAGFVPDYPAVIPAIQHNSTGSR
jgi:hypothetical protein